MIDGAFFMGVKKMAGRPTKITPTVLAKIEEAFMLGATQAEAAMYAGIAERTLRNYKESHPEFVPRIETLKGMTTLRAKANIKGAIEENDISTSKWHLEKTQEDYNPKQKKEHSGELTITPYEKLIQDLSDGKPTKD